MAKTNTSKIIKIGKIKIGGDSPLVLIAGPCVIESEKSALSHAKAIYKITKKHQIPWIFKSSYDKANRTSKDSYRGPGFIQGIKILMKIKQEFDVPILTDVHNVQEARMIKNIKIIDIVQIPAFLCRQTDLVQEIAKTNKVINIKKGQFLAPEDIKHIIKKIEAVGNSKILLTERGSSFGYHTLVNDFRSLVIMSKTGYPVVYDATHSQQLPSIGKCSGGTPEFILPLSRAAVSCGCNAIFVEVHKNPKKAKCDGANSLSLTELPELIKQVNTLDKVRRNRIY